MLGDIFKPFIEASPLSVMMRGLVERRLNPEQMDQWFEPFAQEQQPFLGELAAVAAAALRSLPLTHEGDL